MTNGNYNSSDWSVSINTVMACIIVLFFRSSLCDFLVHLVLISMCERPNDILGTGRKDMKSLLLVKLV